MKRIVICLDGTWNKVAKSNKVTNVVKFAQSVKAIASDGVQQVVYYNSGVGTGGPVDRCLGGIFGAGVKANVHRAYSFLTLNFNEGDEIYILGFSRGAYTARALAAIVNAVGVLRREEFERFEEAWQYYRVPPDVRKAERLERANGQAPAPSTEPTQEQETICQRIEDKREEWFRRTKVRALGVWDTVGSYGVPAGFAISGLAYAFTVRHLGFHDRRLGNNIENAFHAIAIDEARAPFRPTFWTRRETDAKPKGHVEQVWFPGVHVDVGGGQPMAGLSDLALIWMMDRMAGTGLDLDDAFVRANVDPCPGCELHQSRSRWWRLLRQHRRRLFDDREPIRDHEGRTEVVLEEKLHWSVAERLKAGGVFGGKVRPYQPANVRQPVATLLVAPRGPFETRILGTRRDRPYPTPWSGHHEKCWTASLPEAWLLADAPASERLAARAG